MKILFGIVGLVASLIFFAITAFVWFYQYNMEVNEKSVRYFYLGMMALEIAFIVGFFWFTFKEFKKQITDQQKTNSKK